MLTRKLDQDDRTVIGFTHKGRPIFSIAGGSGTDAPPVGDQTASTVDAAVAALAAAGDGGTAPAGGTPPANGTAPETTADAQPSGTDGEQPKGQDLIAPYLDGLSGRERDLVAERLERFRQESDRNANSKIQQLSEQLSGFHKFTDDPDQLGPIVDLYTWLMQEPQAALPWVVGALNTERGVDLETLRDPLLESLGIQQPPSGAGAGTETPSGSTGAEEAADKPLTRADLESFAQEQQRQSEAEAAAAQQREEATTQLNGWTEDALEKFGLKDRIAADSPMRSFIYQQAHQLMQSRQVTNGRIAIETAVEQVKSFLDTQNPTGTGTPAPGQDPKIADGGSPAGTPSGFDHRDSKQRKEVAADRLAAALNTEG